MLEHSCWCIFCAESIWLCLISKGDSNSFEKGFKSLENKKKRGTFSLPGFLPTRPALWPSTLQHRQPASFLLLLGPQASPARERQQQQPPPSSVCRRQLGPTPHLPPRLGVELESDRTTRSTRLGVRATSCPYKG